MALLWLSSGLGIYRGLSFGWAGLCCLWVSLIPRVLEFNTNSEETEAVVSNYLRLALGHYGFCRYGRILLGKIKRCCWKHPRHTPEGF